MDPSLCVSSRAARFVDEYMLDGNGTAAACRAGYARRSAHVAASRLLRNDKVQAALEERRRVVEAQLAVDRQRVLRELVEAVDLARAQGNPAAMIAGWREIAKMCGYYKPECRRVEIGVTGEQLRHRIERMTDHELIAMLRS